MLRRKRIFIAVAFIGLPALLVITFFLTRTFWQREWITENCQADLIPRLPVLKRSEIQPNSAFDLLRRAEETRMKIPQPDAAQLHDELVRLNLDQWSDASFPHTSRLLSQAGAALDLARSAATAPKPQVASYLKATDSLDDVRPVMRISDLFRACAAKKVEAGDFSGAYDDLQTSIALAEILSRGGVLVHVLVEVTCEAQTLSAMRRIALQRNVPPEVAARAITQLLETSRSIEPLSETFRNECRAVPGEIDYFLDASKPAFLGPMSDEESASSERKVRFVAGKLGWLFGSSREIVNTDLGRVYQCLINIANEPYDGRALQRLQDTLVPPMEPHALLLLRDPVGYLIARTTVPIFPPIITRYHLRATNIGATVLVIALRQYEQAEHRLPPNLQKLVPRYLAEIPSDPFAGKPLRYRIEPNGEWRVYSVGPNQVDEGGDRPKTDPHKYTDPGDLVFGSFEPEAERARLARAAKK